MDTQYYFQHKITQGREAKLRERRIHARHLADARTSTSALRPDGRSAPGGVLAMLSALLRRRGPSAEGRRARPASGAAGMASTVADTRVGSLGVTAALTAEVAIKTVLEMTEAICRLPDGSSGRIAIERGADETWVAVCVATPVPAGTDA